MPSRPTASSMPSTSAQGPREPAGRFQSRPVTATRSTSGAVYVSFRTRCTFDRLVLRRARGRRRTRERQARRRERRSSCGGGHVRHSPGEGNLGGIWGWGGVSVDRCGRALYTGVGNSYFHDPACDCYSDTAAYGNSMIKLTPTLRVLDWNRPKPHLSTGDYDFGSAPMLFQPRGCPHLAAGAKDRRRDCGVLHRRPLSLRSPLADEHGLRG